MIIKKYNYQLLYKGRESDVIIGVNAVNKKASLKTLNYLARYLTEDFKFKLISVVAFKSPYEVITFQLDTFKHITSTDVEQIMNYIREEFLWKLTFTKPPKRAH